MTHVIRHALTGLSLCVALAAGMPLAGAGDNEDADAIAELKQVGLDLSKPQTIDFAFYLPARKSAEQLAPKLIAKGYKTRIQPAGGGKDYLLYARKRMLVTEDAMLERRKEFEALAGSVQGEYDGWGSPSAR
jgi:hypothetical protein